MPAAAIVIIPTHDHGATLHLSVPSALAQTVADVEVVIIGDGMPEEAAEAAREVAALDERVRLLELPKGPRLGEIHRHAVLAETRARHVFYLSDDDLWLPEHVETLSELLEERGADFVSTRPAACLGDGTWTLAPIDLALPFHRGAMRKGHNRVGLSDAAHTLDAYRRLPHGWRTAPPDTPSDLHMWQQWLEQPWPRYATAPLPTVLHFPSHERREMPAVERLRELEEHRAVLHDPAARAAWLARLITDDFAHAAWVEAHWHEQERWLADRQTALDWHVKRLAEAVESIKWLNSALARAQAGG